MSTHLADNFHTKRIAFIMMPDGRFLIAPKNSKMSHEQMLINIGMPVGDIKRLLMNIPRGYFMNAELCIYQGTDMTPGAIWQLAPENYDVVRSYVPKFQQDFLVNDDTNLYLGVRVGKIGDVWDRLYKTTMGAFVDSKFQMQR